jgi:hypothetical protein
MAGAAVVRAARLRGLSNQWDLNHNVYVLKRIALANSGFEDVHLGAAVALIFKPP